MSEQNAQDINQMMSSSSEIPVVQPKKSRFIWVLLGCVVIGVGLGLVAYQQSTKDAPSLKTTPRPTTSTTSVATPVASPTIGGLESPVPGQISEVVPVANTVSFPKAGEIVLYSSTGGLKIELTVGSKVTTVNVPAGDPTSPAMKEISTGVILTGPASVKIKSWLSGDLVNASRGWIVPNAQNKCGANGATQIDILAQLNWVKTKVSSEPIVSKQCWADYDPPDNKGVTEPADFNDYFFVWSYKVNTTTSPSPSASSVAGSASPSPSPSVQASAIGSPAAGTAVVSPAPSARATMPDTSGGVPVTGIFEITMGTVSAGLILLILGLLGLLAL